MHSWTPWITVSVVACTFGILVCAILKHHFNVSTRILDPIVYPLTGISGVGILVQIAVFLVNGGHP